MCEECFLLKEFPQHHIPYNHTDPTHVVCVFLPN